MGACYSNYKGGVGAREGRARGGRRLQPNIVPDAAGVWLKLGAAGARPRACPPRDARGEKRKGDRIKDSGETRRRDSEREREPQRAKLREAKQRDKHTALESDGRCRGQKLKAGNGKSRFRAQDLVSHRRNIVSYCRLGHSPSSLGLGLYPFCKLGPQLLFKL